MVLVMLLAYKYIVNNFFMTILNFYLIPQIVHNALKGQQSMPNYFYLYSLMASRSLLPVICLEKNLLIKLFKAVF